MSVWVQVRDIRYVQLHGHASSESRSYDQVLVRRPLPGFRV